MNMFFRYFHDWSPPLLYSHSFIYSSESKSILSSNSPEEYEFNLRKYGILENNEDSDHNYIKESAQTAYNMYDRVNGKYKYNKNDVEYRNRIDDVLDYLDGFSGTDIGLKIKGCSTRTISKIVQAFPRKASDILNIVAPSMCYAGKKSVERIVEEGQQNEAA